MLEPVALHQTGFKVPGLVQDTRGVVVGTQAALLLLLGERLVAVLRLLSQEAPLDDVLPSLHVEQVRNPLGAQAYLLRFSCADSLLLDRWAATARLAGAALSVGAGKHFVPYRDRRAPLGYDARELFSEKPSADYILYTETSAQPFTRVRGVPLLQLIAQLGLLPTAGGASVALRALGQGGGQTDAAGDAVSAAAATLTEPLWLTVPTGLLGRTARYLWERGAKAEVATPDALPPPGAPSAAGLNPGDEELALLRISSAKVALLDRLLSIPGVHLYRSATPATGVHLAVELGHTHPLRLLPFASLFAADKVHLFSRQRRGFTSLLITQLIPIERLVELRPEGAPYLGQPAPIKTQTTSGTAAMRAKTKLVLRVPLELVAGTVASGQRTPTASLIPWTRALWLSRLVYTLPAALLAGLQAASIDEGLLIVGAAGVHALPLGLLLYEPTPGVFIPLGSELRPQLQGELLAAQLGGVSDRYVLLLPAAGAAPPIALALQKSLLMPLSQQLLSPLLPTARSATTRDEPPAPELQNTAISPLSMFALWPLWGRLEDDGG